jgi:hypothetical protein
MCYVQGRRLFSHRDPSTRPERNPIFFFSFLLELCHFRGFPSFIAFLHSDINAITVTLSSNLSLVRTLHTFYCLQDLYRSCILFHWVTCHSYLENSGKNLVWKPFYYLTSAITCCHCKASLSEYKSREHKIPLQFIYCLLWRRTKSSNFSLHIFWKAE